ncbi:MAG: hypothetical protein VKQ33_14560 [Candidatus Sericytochromatia bacterium]|nr:hypothetical protein [Candidatus Sericytochromatia bacterium]
MNAPLLRLTGCWLLPLAVLAGCGGRPPLAFKPDAPAAPPGLAGPTPAPGGATPVTQRVLEALAARVATTATWRARVTTELVDPTGKRETNTLRMCYRKPGTVASTVLEASDGKQVGTKLVFGPNGRVKLKTWFFGILPLKFDVPVSDARLLDSYGRSMRENTAEHLCGLLLDPASTVTWAGEGTLDGEPYDRLAVRSTRLWKAFTHEHVGVSRRLGLPVVREAFARGGKRVLLHELHGMVLNPSLPPAEFQVQ